MFPGPYRNTNKFILFFAAIIFLPFVTKPGSTPSSGPITPKVETAPVAESTDAADDMAIWIHPNDPSLSTIIGTDKQGSLNVYDLSGKQLQSIPIATANVDIRYNFPLGKERVALVTAYDRTHARLAAFKVDPNSRKLIDVLDPTNANVEYGGSAMYHSPNTGKYYYLSNRNGVLRQYELVDTGSGKVMARLVRTVNYAPSTHETEGVVADDVLARIYVSDEDYAIYRFEADPNSSTDLTTVDMPVDKGGHYIPDVEGLSIYYISDGSGYLFASSQGNSTYTVYNRNGDNSFIGKFAISDGTVDGASNTDGIDVTNLPLGDAFPKGVFIAQDGQNMQGGKKENQDFKLVPFESIASSLGLTMDTTWDPRKVGG